MASVDLRNEMRKFMACPQKRCDFFSSSQRKENDVKPEKRNEMVRVREHRISANAYSLKKKNIILFNKKKKKKRKKFN